MCLSYQIGHAAVLDVRDEDTTADFRMFTFDDHDAQTGRSLHSFQSSNSSSSSSNNNNNKNKNTPTINQRVRLDE